MRYIVALLLTLLGSAAFAGQQYQATPVSPKPDFKKMLGQTAADKPFTDQIKAKPIDDQPKVLMQQKGSPLGSASCPAGLDAAQTAAMKAKLTSLLNAATVKALEEGAAKEACPNVAFALTFAQIVLGDDISITKAKP